VAGIRQFDRSIPGATAPLGRSDNYPRSVASRLGAEPARAVLEVAGGQGPQHLVTELAGVIADGRSEVALVFGSEASSTTRHLAGAPDRPDWAERVGGQLEDRGHGLEGLLTRYQLVHGLTDAPSRYALLEHARRGARGQRRGEYLLEMGRLFAPFTRVAAANPHAAAPTVRTAEELATPTGRNRLIADPYPRMLVARDLVNQGAAVLLMSVQAAERLGVARDRRVFLHGHADLRERALLERRDLGACPAAVMAVEHALAQAGVGLGDLGTIDLYSCFPVAVSAACDGLGLAPDDPRGLTVTGGLPFFGGPGNNYSMHAIAETVLRLRARPGAFGLVGANGGILSRYSVGVYSTTPAPWPPGTGAPLQAEIDSWPAPDQAVEADGWARVETYTVRYGRDGATGIVVGRLADGRRFLARTGDGDEETLGALTGADPLGARLFVRSFGFGNRVATTRALMDRLQPSPPAVLADD
jgi:acetyl-CoA C-acetyltransferase